MNSFALNSVPLNVFDTTDVVPVVPNTVRRLVGSWSVIGPESGIEEEDG